MCTVQFAAWRRGESTVWRRCQCSDTSTKVLEAAERRRRDNEHCRNVLREGASHEVLGVESSDEDDSSATVGAEGSRRQHASGSDTAETIILEDDEVAAPRPRVLTMSSASDCSTPAIINLLDDQDEEKSDVPSRQPSTSTSV